MKYTICILTLGFGLLALPIAPVGAASEPSARGPEDLDAKIVQLSRKGTRAQDVLSALGKPEAYVWGSRTFTTNDLPNNYIMRYPKGLSVMIGGGLVGELRAELPGPGFTWRGKLRLGSSLEEVLGVVGQPSETLTGKPLAFAPGVLYKDADGRKGFGYYARPDKNVRFFFDDNKVAALYVTLEIDSAALQYRTALSPAGSLAIVRRPPPAEFERGPLSALPAYDLRNARNPFQVDVRSQDLSKLDLAGRQTDLLHSDFDSKTRWPAQLPSGFVPARLMELGKDPGLGVRRLHAQGITGKGISVGVIDQALLTSHSEYRDRLRLYEEIHLGDSSAQMHGPAVASIAVGKTIGVAPEADLYYIAETHGNFSGEDKFEWDFTHLAQSIDRMLEINSTLPKEKKIRVISISVGWDPRQKGYDAVTAAADRAKQAGVFVISTALETTHRLAFHGLGRPPLADPNAAASYGPGSWWASMFWSGQRRFAPGQRLLVPMDSRCLASPTGDDDFVFYADGGWSWSVPWIAGLYALACQVQPDITPERFWAEAIKTGETITLRQDGKEVSFGTIANPVALIESLKCQTHN